MATSKENYDSRIEHIIATEVMGWHKSKLWWIPIELSSLSEADLKRCRVIEMWHPLNNVVDALDVLEKLADLGHVILIKTDGKRDVQHRYNAIVINGMSSSFPSPMEAICDIALTMTTKNRKA